MNEFDPIQPIKKREEKSYDGILSNLFKRGEEEEGVEREGRRYIFWRKSQGLENNLTERFMGKIREKARTAAYLHHYYSYWLENIEDETILLFYKNSGGSPWINKYDEAENWLREKEEARLNTDNIERPNTKWTVFRGYSDVDVKVVLDRQPLLGTGPLPDWLRNLAHARAGPMVTLDTYQDNLCLWRCIAVHRGARPDRSTTAARELAKSFFKLRAAPTDIPKTSLDELDKVERHLNQGAAFSDWLGIRVYEPEGEVIWHLRRNPSTKLTKHSDNRYLRGARIRYQEYRKVGEYVCMCSLPRKIHSSLPPSTAYPKVRPSELGDRLPGRKSRSTADSFREGLLPKKLCFPRITSVA